MQRRDDPQRTPSEMLVLLYATALLGLMTVSTHAESEQPALTKAMFVGDLATFTSSPAAVSLEDIAKSIDARAASLSLEKKTRRPQIDALIGDVAIEVWAVDNGDLFGRATHATEGTLAALVFSRETGDAAWWGRHQAVGSLDADRLPRGASLGWAKAQLQAVATRVLDDAAGFDSKSAGLSGGTLGRPYMLACNANPALCVEDMVLAFTPTDDAWVDQDHPFTTHPDSHALRLRAMDTGSGRHSYIKYDVRHAALDDLVHRQISKVKLSLRAGNYGLRDLHGWHMVSNGWNEHTLTWSNASIAVHGARIIADTVPWAPSETRAFTITDTVSGPGEVTYGLSSGPAADNYVWSKDSPVQASWPTLRVRFRYRIP